MELTADTWARDVLDSLAAALGAAAVGGQPVFPGGVSVADDVAGFERTADPLRGTAAAVIGRAPEVGQPQDNGDARTERIATEVAVRFAVQRAPGESERGAVVEAARLADLVRQAVRQDPTRGGLCHAIEWGGAVLDSTDCKGAFRFAGGGTSGGAGHYTALVAVTVCRSVGGQ